MVGCYRNILASSMPEEGGNRSLTSSDYAQTKFTTLATPTQGAHNYVPFLHKSTRFTSNNHPAAPPIGTSLITQGPTTCPPASTARNLPSRTASATSYWKATGATSRWASSSQHSPDFTSRPPTPQAPPPTSTPTHTQSLQLNNHPQEVPHSRGKGKYRND